MWRFGILGDECDLQGVFDGGPAADGGQETFETGELLKPVTDLGLVAGAGVRTSPNRVE